MTLPYDQTLTKIRILRQREAARAAPLIMQLEKAVYEARRADELLQQRFVTRCEQLGYCPHCEMPIGECKGHVFYA